jgi:PTH1 family peptidyl-tRNA hydrolase
MLLIAGLGNPGPTYAKNRHNIGFMAVDEIARRWGFPAALFAFPRRGFGGRHPTPGRARCATLILKARRATITKSGRAVGEALNFFKLDPADLVVFYDEIDLAPGRFRMKAGGGAAGNNGVRSITSQVGPTSAAPGRAPGHPGDKDLVHGTCCRTSKDRPEVGGAAAGRLRRRGPLAGAGEDEKYQDRGDAPGAGRETRPAQAGARGNSHARPVRPFARVLDPAVRPRRAHRAARCTG